MRRVSANGREPSGGAVLIGFAEALSAPEVAWSLIEAGHRVVAFTRRGRRPPLRRCPQVELRPITAPETDADSATAELRSLVEATGATAVLPLDDFSLWLVDRAGGELPARVVGPTGELARLALDKRLQLDAAANSGLPVPATIRLRSAGSATGERGFPLVMKPALAVREQRGKLTRSAPHVCANERELSSAARRLGDQPVLLQPLLHGVGEGIFGLAAAEGVHAWSAHRRIRMMNPQGSGSSACASRPVDLTLRAGTEAMLEAVAWSGLFMAEFVREASGRTWFMELNGRPWGSMALARRAGFEYPAWAVRMALEPEFRPSQPPPNGDIRCRHLGREVVHVLTVLRGPKSAALSDWPPRARTVRDVLRVDRQDAWYNWRRGETALFLEDSIRTVAEALLPRRT